MKNRLDLTNLRISYGEIHPKRLLVPLLYPPKPHRPNRQTLTVAPKDVLPRNQEKAAPRGLTCRMHEKNLRP